MKGKIWPCRSLHQSIAALGILLVMILVGCTGNKVGNGTSSSPTAQGTPERVQAAPSPSRANEKTSGFTNLTPQQLSEMLSRKDFVLINVHIPFEGNLPATDLSIPFDDIDKQVAKLPADKQAKIVVYCRSGSMSLTAANQLVSLGYRNVYNLEAGMRGWTAAGYKLAD